jgi:hypothetical protein
MRLIYIDDSGDETAAVYSALCIRDTQWRECFRMLKSHRQDLRRRFGIYVRKELHATELVAGRGQLADRVVTKHQRSVVFQETIHLIANMPGIRILNACDGRKTKALLFERLVNRINRTLQAWDERGILLVDEGSENEYTRLLRRMAVYNPIPSNQGVWTETGTPSKNIPVEWIVEDPVFKDSRSSFFLQCADMVAFSLLRNEHPLPSRSKYGLDKCFDVLDSVLVKQAFAKDPRKKGIVRA